MKRKFRGLEKLYLLAINALLFIVLLLFVCVGKTSIQIVSALACVTLLAIVFNLYNEERAKTRYIYIVVLFLTTFATRIIYCLIMEPEVKQFSDFDYTLHGAMYGIFIDKLEYYRMFLHKLIYPYLLHAFGFRTQRLILILQCFCVAWIPVFLFLIGEKISNKKLGLSAGILYILFPSQTSYLIVTTEEHVAALILTALFYWIVCIVQKIEKIQTFSPVMIFSFIIEFILFGALCGLCAYFKDWAIILLIAFLFSSFYLFFQYNKRQRITLLLGVLLIFFSRNMVNFAITTFAESLLGTNANNGVVYWQIFETMDPNVSETGLYNSEKFAEYEQIVEKYNYDFDKANEEALSITMEKVKENYQLMPEYLLKKGRDAYGDEVSISWWSLQGEIKDEFKSQFYSKFVLLNNVSTIYYVCIVICIMIACITTRRKEEVFCLFVILGGILAGLLIESQGRYRYNIEPIWCLAAACGLHQLEDLLHNFLAKKRAEQ